jgi:hypothetical protein
MKSREHEREEKINNFLMRKDMKREEEKEGYDRYEKKSERKAKEER